MTTSRTTPLRRAVLLMTLSSVLVPAAGLLTQPVLARALGPVGRGELMAALAPAVLLSSVATLGLPEALTYLIARRPWIARSAIGWSVLFSVGIGAICVLVTVLAASFLSGGDPDLAALIVLSMALWIPVFVVGSFRGAARGRQMWVVLALDSVIGSGLRVLGYLVLWLLDELTVLSALVVTAASPILAGVVYWRLLTRRSTDAEPEEPVGKEPAEPAGARVLRPLLAYGVRAWFGSVATMLLARTSQVLMVPLSSARDLGLYTVAIAVSDIPITVAMAVSGALQGVNSRSNDPEQVARTSRVVLLVGTIGCTVLAVTLPHWMGPVFGRDFEAALVPALVLLASAALSLPAFVTAAGLAAFGRPGLRSLGYASTFVINLGGFLLLVPRFGVIGATWTSVVASTFMSAFMVVAAARVMGKPVDQFVRIRHDDVAFVWREGTALLRRAPRRGLRRRSGTSTSRTP